MTHAHMVQSRRQEARRLWNLACQHDQVPPEEQFVCFSPDNPYAPQYDEVVRLLQINIQQARMMATTIPAM